MQDLNDTQKLDQTHISDRDLIDTHAITSYKSPIPNRLRVVFPDNSTHIYNAIHPQLVIGRRTTNNYRQIDIDMQPYDKGVQSVSRIHAVIVAEKTGLIVKDMRSTNGTQLNNKLLKPAEAYPLISGDRIKVGNLRIQVVFEFDD
jgi:pSer/pThr/pTyr-binding forkhead associated (FHA) protein